MNHSYKKMSIWVCLSLVAIVLLAFFILFGQLSAKNTALKQELDTVKREKTDAEQRAYQLQKQLKEASNDSYLGNIAREKYGYMSENEKRIVILHPELLYQDTNVENPS